MRPAGEAGVDCLAAKARSHGRKLPVKNSADRCLCGAFYRAYCNARERARLSNSKFETGERANHTCLSK